MLIDSHAHLNFDEYNNELGDVIERSLNSNTQIITVGSNFVASQKALAIAAKHNGIWAVVGCHPDDLSLEEFDLSKYRELAQSSNKVVGIGEVGLDYYRLDQGAEEVKLKQKEVFKQFIELAQELDLPLVLHCRGAKDDPSGAYEEMLEIIGTELSASGLGQKRPQLRGVIHCFGGNLEQAKKFVDLGFYVGFTGIITFKNAKEVQQIAKEVPLDKILIETDAPFLAPEPYRGQRNEPSYVKYVAQKIADLRQLTFSEVEVQTYQNTTNLFGI